MSASPIVPQNVRDLAITPGAPFCNALIKNLLQSNPVLAQIVAYMFDDSGNVTDGFRNALLPVGNVIWMAGPTAPPGQWLECNGQEVSRSIASGGVVDTYKSLYEQLGITFGAGNGTSTFNVPNLSGRAPIGAGTLKYADATAGELYTLAQMKGKEKVELIAAEIPPVIPVMKTEGAKLHVRTFGGGGNEGNAGTGAFYNLTPEEAFTEKDEAEIDADGDPVTDPAEGSSDEHENRTPSLVLRAWVKY